MKINKIACRLEVWRGRREELDAQLDALRAVLNPSPENPLFDAIDEIFTGYTVTTSQIIGDEGGWLLWYWQDRQMGRNPGDAILEEGAAPIRVDRDLRTLAKVIAWRPEA